MPNRDALELFHPATRAWFGSAFAAPTPAQLEAWPAIQAGHHALIAAPTGSGKTLAAFLAAIDALVREGVEHGLADETRVVYVSPLKALSNDIQRNLEAPLAGIRAELQRLGLPEAKIRAWVRTGDTPHGEREQMRRRPPHIVVTTPESLYILLTSRSGRRMLATTRTVIVDEIHALAPNKRGAHLALSLERLEALAGREPVRIGLSATQKPIETVARFLVGDRTDRDGTPACTIVDTGHVRRRDLAIELPASPLEAVMSGEIWQQVYDRLEELVREHRTTLVFVNTRRLAERAARSLSERIGEAFVTAHHGSLARGQRLDAEQRLKRGELRALVATASLELGIDIGDVDLVCQLGSTRSIAALLQRVGRSGHAVGGVPKGRLFPLSRDELCECAAALDAVRRGELDRLRLPVKPLDVLAQQIVAEVALQEWNEDALFERVRRATPFRELTRAEFGDVVRMLAEGFHTRRGRRSAHLHRDAVNGVLRGRRGAALAAVTSGGTIPDTADYAVLLEPQAQVIGTVNEDFAVESLAGDVFQLGNHSYRIMRIERGTVRVEDAGGQPPSMPFWLGEAPGRTAELSQAASDLRKAIEAQLAAGGRSQALGWLTATVGPATRALGWLTATVGLQTAAAEQIVDYLAAAKAALGVLPTVETIVLERFFDESGGMQLVVHSPFGSRVNRAWGLALRKRFCRKFDFELQAAATEDAIVLSLATAHSFPLADVARYLCAATVRPLLVQALIAAPMFGTRWRWNASVALALLRFQGGRKVAPQLQRMAAEDLMATIFPDQVACFENIVGDREIPDHPLVRQTIEDCLHEAMDIEGLEQVLGAIEEARIEVVACDLTEPSPLALEILSARPYAFLDDAPLEERRTQAVLARRWIDADAAAGLGRLDLDAIRRVQEEVWPQARSADELHDALLSLACLTGAEIGAQGSWAPLIDELAAARRATRVASGASGLFVAAERLPEFEAVFARAERAPAIEPPAEFRKRWTPEAALAEILRDRLQGLGPVSAAQLAVSLGLPEPQIEAALLTLESEGSVMRGSFTPAGRDDGRNDGADSSPAARSEWCERRLLARIHRYTVNRLRREIEPVEARDFLRFLFEWQRVAPEARVEGADALAGIVAQLEGFEAPAAAWETEILPARVNEYDPAWLDELSRAGRLVWTRIAPLHASGERAPAPVRTTPIALTSRRNLAIWSALARDGDGAPLTSRAQRVVEFITAHGASFFDEIADGSGLLRTQVEEALGELVAQGLVNADSFGGLRALLVPSERRRSLDGGAERGRRLRRTVLFGIEDAGRWALARRKRPEAGGAPDAVDDPAIVEQVARTLLRRYGVVFWRLAAREADWLPPWRNLLRCYRRLEARGEIRGGRFVAGVSGEQFAAPEAIGLLRDMRRREGAGALVSLSGADPLNLIGIVTAGPRLPALTGNRVLYRDGVPIASLVANEVRFLETLDAETQWSARAALLRRQVPVTLQYLA